MAENLDGNSISLSELQVTKYCVNRARRSDLITEAEVTWQFFPKNSEKFQHFSWNLSELFLCFDFHSLALA